MPTNFSPRRIALFFGVIIVVFFVVTAVKGVFQNSLGLSGSVITMNAPMAPSFRGDTDGYAMGMSARLENGVSYTESSMPSPIPVPGGDAPAGVSKIIRNADLTLLVDDVDVGAQMIERVRNEYGGQAGNASFRHYGTSRTGDVTIWVPSDRFDAALAAIKKGALKVESERVSVSDVSAQFVDLQARLKNMQATEAQYLEIMKRSGSIPDVLSVTRELSQTRQTIEQLQGQLNYLSRQVALSSIHVVFTEEATPTLSKDEWRPLSVIKSASRDTLRDLTKFIDALLVFVIKLPLLLLQLAFWGVLLFLVWRGALFAYAHIKGARLPETDGKL